MAKGTKDLEAGLHDQTNLLPLRELLKVFFTMSLCLCVCFIDQNGIGVLLPSIAKDLNAQSTIAWAGTSALIANTVFQVLYGRLSDLFGRKIIFLSALVLLSISDLIVSLAANSTVLYVFRGLAGVANGGIVSLTNMIVSDIVTLQQRGKYQGILGSMIGVGNAAGPLIAAGFAENATWRGLFWLLAPLALCAAALAYVVLPSTMPKVNFRETIRKVDFLGLLFGSLAIILILIPISEGGHEKPWGSPEVIAMLTVGGVCAVVFVLVEWKIAKLPMMPLDMYRKPSVAAMLLQSFLLGVCYYSYLYYLPIYYQNVHGYSIIMSAVLILPLVLSQSIFSVIGGQYLSRMNRYGELLWAGFGIWTLGAGLLILCDRQTTAGTICGFLILIGVGVGFTFQPTIVALQAHCSKAQRAVIISNRNLLRSLGGAVGLAISSALTGNVLQSSLPAKLQYIAASTFALPDLDTFSRADRITIEDAYADASRTVFIFCTPVIGVALLCNIFVKDKGLQRKEERDEKQQQQPQQLVEMDESLQKGGLDVVASKLTSESKDKGHALDDPSTDRDLSQKPSNSSIKSRISRASKDK
ncbi:hypothetical protein AAFC00_005156 [Neodothiora populina]|uniref:Major facilitator superfamily (MFS) profile domain-containing protein n=1 Tax=Neodothiora populina TaxID=2781224 RepID=A0ABR3PKC3_9PEZI